MAARLTAVKNYTATIAFAERPAQKERLVALARHQGRKPSAVLRDALAAYLEANPTPTTTKPRKKLRKPQRLF